MLTRASLSSPANRRSEVPLLSLTRVSLPYVPITLQSSSPIRAPVLAIAYIRTNRQSLLDTRLTALSKSAQNTAFCSRVLDTVSVGLYATIKVTALDLPVKLKVIDIRRSFVSSCVHVASRMIDSLTANPTPCCPARPVLPSTPLQNTRYPAVANSVRPGLRVSCSPMMSQPSTLHFCKSTSAWPAPRRPVRDNERIFQVDILSSPVRDRALVSF